MVLENHPDVNFVALDIIDPPKDREYPKNFKFIKNNIPKD